MKPILLLASLFLVAAIVLVACVRHSIDNTIEDEHPLAVTVLATDGMRTLEKILRMPSLTITVANGSDETCYEAAFRVNDGPERTVRNIWNGVPKDLSGEFLSQTEYGAIYIKGFLIDTSAPSERIAIDTVLWMAYAPSLHSTVSIVTPDRDETLLPETAFSVGETGHLEMRYTPEDTFLPISITVPEGSPLALHGELLSPGGYRIPFSVEAPGETTVTVTIENGRERETLEYSVLCKESAPMPEEPDYPDDI